MEGVSIALAPDIPAAEEQPQEQGGRLGHVAAVVEKPARVHRSAPKIEELVDPVRTAVGEAADGARGVPRKLVNS